MDRMLRWFKKEGSEKAGKAAGAPADDWAYLRSQPDFDADEMADVRSPHPEKTLSTSSDWPHSSNQTDGISAFAAAEPYFEAPAPVVSAAAPSAAAWKAPERRPAFSAEEAPELQLTITCAGSETDECLKGSVLIGKLDLDREVFPEIDLSIDRDVSPRHAMILLRASGYVLKDVGSESGTFLNGRRLVLGEETPLAPGDEIKIGAATSIVIPGAVVAEDDILLSDEDLALAELALQASGAMPLPQPRFAVPPVAPAPQPQIPAAPMDLLDLALVRGESLAAGGADEEFAAVLPRRDFGAADYRSPEISEFEETGRRDRSMECPLS
jgi:hypothetical protein